MKKQQTLAEMTDGMNEFEKFLFFRHKAKELDQLQEAWSTLLVFGDLSTPEIMKGMRISAERWNSYLEGVVPLPLKFLLHFNRKFSEQLHIARMKKNNRQMDWYMDLGRKVMDQHHADNLSDIDTKEPVSSPSIKTA